MMFKKTRFIEADVERIDCDAHMVYARHSPDDYHYEIEYDHLVLALGGVTNRRLVPGSESAIGFKTLADAIYLRNRIIDLFEQADVEEDLDRRRQLLTIVIVGGGLVGVELMGELTEFVHNTLRSYPRIQREMIRFVLVEAHPRIMPEMEEELANYAAEVLRGRGVEIVTGVRVKSIEPGKVILPEGAIRGTTVINAETVILAAGLTANPLLAGLPLEKAKNGRVVVEGTMRSRQRPEVWALGDCAAIPDKNGNPYPPLAQHALREAKTLARNIASVLREGDKATLKPFVYQTMGMLASLGSYRGVGRIGKIKIRGFLAWWVWRTYYLLQMPRWERRFRLVLDWTVALFFRNDVVKLDLQTVAKEASRDLELHGLQRIG
jgi:NADH dehydrogenase